MTLADQIRNSFRLSDDFFKKNIIPALTRSGHTYVICDDHIDEVKSYAIPSKYENSLQDWARENGFHTTYWYNSYGVRHIKIYI